MNITTSNYNILDSGSIIIPENEFIEFEFGKLRFRFTFLIDDEKLKENHTNITGEVRNDEAGDFFHIKVYNFSGLFATPSQSLSVGQYEGKELLVCFSIVELGNNVSQLSRIFHYTWYQSKQVV